MGQFNKAHHDAVKAKELNSEWPKVREILLPSFWIQFGNLIDVMAAILGINYSHCVNAFTSISPESFSYSDILPHEICKVKQ